MNTLSIIKDIIISAVIAVLTSGLFEASNIVYQSVITVLILVIIFLILRGIDKKAKRMEVLSILYVEQFLVPFTNALNNTENIQGNTNFTQAKVFILLPESISDLSSIKEITMQLDKFSINNPDNKFRPFYASGKVITPNQLTIFDTPMTWVAGLEHLNKTKNMNQKKLSQLIVKMTRDIKDYAKKIDRNNNTFKNLSFISFTDYKKHYC